MFGKRLAQLRQEKGLSQTKLAQRAGLTQGHISQLESGRRRPLFDTCQKLAEALDLSVNELSKADNAPN